MITFVTIYQLLSHLDGITTKLQSTAIDIANAYSMVDEIKELYSQVRANADATFHPIYEQAILMANKVGTEPSKPRIAGRQEHRSNTPSDTVEQYYLRNLCIPFLDTIIAELNAQFSTLTTTSVNILGLVPSVVCTQETDLSKAVDMYKNDLLSPELFQQELFRWKVKWQNRSPEERHKSCATAIKQCDKDLLPNIFILLKLACTLPVTSCECERSASTLRRLDNFMRHCMKEDRLPSLALIHSL